MEVTGIRKGYGNGGVTAGFFLVDITEHEASRMDSLMAQYADVPMDLADSSIVAVSESTRFRKVFTVDSDFYIYRMVDGSVLEPLQ